MNQMNSGAKHLLINDVSIRIEPTEGWVPVDLRELWQYHNLLFYLVWREIRVYYSNTAIGIFWIVLSPLATAIVLSVILGLFIKVPTGGLPYPPVVLSGLILWLYFSKAVSTGCTSMMANSYLLTKVYFPRIIVPLVSILSGLIELLVLLVVVLIVAILYGVVPGLSWLLIPVPLILLIGLATGSSLWLSALNVQYRDIGNLLPVLLQVGLYLAPTIYLSSLIPKEWRLLYDINPMVGVIDTMRWALFLGNEFPARPFIISIITVILLIVTGAFFFRLIDDTAADIV